MKRGSTNEITLVIFCDVLAGCSFFIATSSVSSILTGSSSMVSLVSIVADAVIAYCTYFSFLYKYKEMRSNGIIRKSLRANIPIAMKNGQTDSNSELRVAISLDMRVFVR